MTLYDPHPTTHGIHYRVNVNGNEIFIIKGAGADGRVIWRIMDCWNNHEIFVPHDDIHYKVCFESLEDLEEYLFVNLL